MINSLEININKEEKEFILERIEKILDSKINWTNSTNVLEFEETMKKITGSNYAIATSTGSTAIEASLIALGIQEGSVVYTQTLTAPPTVLSALSVGAIVVFVDSDKENFGMSLEDLKEKIDEYVTNGCVIPVHIGGYISKNIKDIVEYSHKMGMPVIEDCAHAHGSMIFDKYAGTFGDVGTFSFFLTKTLTSGEGGIIITNNAEIDRKLRMIRNYGKDSDGYHVIKGSSWRMNEFTGVVALSQIRSHNKIILEKQRIAKKYDKLLENNKYFKSLTSQEINGYYKYIIINKSNIPISYLITSMESKYNIKLPGLVYSHLCHEEPFIIGNNKVKGVMKYYKNATFLARNHLCLPIYMGLSEDSVEYIIDCLNRACEDYYSE